MNNTRPVEELIHWWAEEYNKGLGYAKVVLHPEGTLVERPSAAYPEGRVVDLAGLMGMEERQLALQGDRKITLERVAALAEEGHGLMQYSHVGHTPDGAELTFYGLSLFEFRDDLVYRWVDTVVRLRREPGSDELVGY